MKKKYIQPATELILLQTAQLIATSLGANEQIDPGLSRELFEDPEIEQLLNI